jgi:hypothetical protein
MLKHALGYAMTRAMAAKTASRPSTDSGMMGGRQIVEALPSEILRDPSMRDMLNTSMLSLPVLNHLPAIGLRPLMSIDCNKIFRRATSNCCGATRGTPEWPL